MNIDRTAPANFPVGIVLVNGQGVIERLNHQAEVLLSVAQNHVVGQSIVDVLDGQVADATLKTLAGQFGRIPRERTTRNLIASANQLSVSWDALQDTGEQPTWLLSFRKSPPSILPSVFAAAQSAKKWMGKKLFLVVGSILAISIAIYVLPRSASEEHALPSPAPGMLAPINLNGGGVAPKTVDLALSVVGTVEAGDTLSLTAPFDAVIKVKNFSFDAEVSQDQLLLALDTTELLNRFQDAKVAALKAAKTLQELQNWESGAEVARAQRSLIFAQQQVEQTERKVNETETLLKKGIIPRSEYDGIVEQLNGYVSQLAAASGELKAIREKVSKSNLEIARIEYAQAQAKYMELSDSLALEKIASPRAGIIAKAPASSNQAATALEVGSRITKGQLLFNIVSTDELLVSAKVDEADIVDLAPGMKAIVSVDSQDMPPIEGRLARISAQAVQNGGTSRSAAFDIKIEIPELNAAQRRRLRVGMSCNVTIEKSRKNNAAISPANGNPTQ